MSAERMLGEVMPNISNERSEFANPVTVISKRLWKGRYGRATPRIFVQILIAALGLMIKNIVVSARVVPPSQWQYPLPLDGIFRVEDFDQYSIRLPEGVRYYPAVRVDDEHWAEFRRNLLEAMNRVSISQSPMTASAPPDDVAARLARAERRGKVPLLFAGLDDVHQTAHCIRAVGREPAWRWFESYGQQGRLHGHCLHFIFPNQQAADAARAAWTSVMERRGGRILASKVAL